MLRRALALTLTLALLGCSSAEETPDATPMQDQSAAAPGPRPVASLDSPPLGSPRAKIAPDSVVPGAGDRATIR